MSSLEDLARALTPLVTLRFHAVKIGRRLKRVKKLVLQVGVNRERFCVVQCFHKVEDPASYAEYLITGTNVSCAKVNAPRQVPTPYENGHGYETCLMLSGKDLMSRKGRDTGTGALYVFCSDEVQAEMLGSGIAALCQASTTTGSCRFTTLDATLILEASVVRSRKDEASSTTSGLSTRSAASFFQRKTPSLLNQKSKKRWRGSILGRGRGTGTVLEEEQEDVETVSVAEINGGGVSQESRYESDDTVCSMIRAACTVLRRATPPQSVRLFVRLKEDEQSALEALQKRFQAQQLPSPGLSGTDVAVVSALLLYAFDRMPFGVFPAEDYAVYLRSIKVVNSDGVDPISSDAGRTALRFLCRQLPKKSLILLDSIGGLFEEICPERVTWETAAAVFGPRLVYNLRDSCTQTDVFETPILPKRFEELRQVVILLQSVARPENRAYLLEKANVAKDTIAAESNKSEGKADLASSFGLAESSIESKGSNSNNEAIRVLPKLLNKRARVADDDVESRMHAVQRLIVSFRSRLETRPNARNAALWKRELSEYEMEYAKLQKQLQDKDYDHGSLSQLEHINEVIRLWRSSKPLDPDRLLKRNQDSGSKDPRLALLESSELLQKVLGELDQLQHRFGQTPCTVSCAVSDILRESIQFRLQLNDYHNELILRTEEKALEFERRFKGPGSKADETNSPSRGFQWQPTISYLWR